MINEQRQIIKQDAIDAFKKMIGCDAYIKKGKEKFNDTLTLIKNDFKCQYQINVQTNLTRAQISLIAGQLARDDIKHLIISDYVSPPLAGLLQKNDMAFIDAAGNAYINDPPLYVFVKGNKRPENLRRPTLNKAFKAGGLKVIFALLCKPELVNLPYRDIVKNTGVAIGTIAGIFNELKTLGYIIDLGKRGRTLVNREELLNRWVVAYPEQLRPKLKIGLFKQDQKEWWQKAYLTSKDCWGGEAAGALLTDYLKPKNLTIYLKGPEGKLILKNRLQKHPDGNIELLKIFWNFKEPCNKGVVHPILIYADLMATGDQRNIETAKIIYDRKIARLIRED